MENSLSSEQIRENRLKAIEALRTTEKPQGTTDLLRDGCYCAVGVILSEVFDVSDEALSLNQHSPYEYIRDFLDVPAVTIWEKNDLFQWDFKTIAEHLEIEWGLKE